MRPLDINVIVRLLVGDVPHQTPIAGQVFLNAVGSGGIYFQDVVLADQLILAQAARAEAPPAAQGAVVNPHFGCCWPASRPGSRPDSRLDQEGAANPAGSNQVNTNSADFNNNADVNNFALNDGSAEDAAAIKEIQEDPEKLLFRQSRQLRAIIASALH